MKIVITGGCGFIGSNLSLHFASKGHEVLALDNMARRGSEYNLLELLDNGVNFAHADIRNLEDLSVANDGFDVLLECSAQPSAVDGYKNPTYDFTNNTIGVHNCLELCRRHGAGLIFWSTNKVFSADMINALPRTEDEKTWVAPLGWKGFDDKTSIDGGQHSIYGMSKIMADLMVQEYADAFGVKTVVNRFSCLAGPRQWGKCAQGWVAWFVIAAILRRPVRLIGWNGKQVRDVLFVDDICALVEKQIECLPNIAGQVFNVGGGWKNQTSLLQAIEDIESITGETIQYSVEQDPRKADHCIYITDISKAKTVFDWEPKVRLNAGYWKIMNWVQENEDVLKRM